MTSAADPWTAQLEALRRAFDDAFARPREEAGRDGVSLVLLEAGAHALAVPVAALQGVERTGRIAPLPGRDAALLGLAAADGQLLPVFGLARLLGDAPRVGEARWLLRVGAAEPVGLAFSTFQGYASPGRSAITPCTPGDGERFVSAIAETGATRRGVLDVAAIAAALRARAGFTQPEDSSGERTVSP